MALIRLDLLHLPRLDQLDDPPWIEIDHETDATANLRQMLDRQAQPPRTAGPDHEPVRAFRKRVVGQRLAEIRVVDAKVFVRDARLRNARAATRLEHVDWLVGVGLGYPAADGTAPQPLVFEGAELAQ